MVQWDYHRLEDYCAYFPLIHQKLNGTLPTARAIRYPGLGVRSVVPVGDFLEFRMVSYQVPCWSLGRVISFQCTELMFKWIDSV